MIKLSICMMVKNEEMNLERCLESLSGIRKCIDCELIIVDTGSTDNTMSIAKRYTDRVYFKEWSNHFSQMRNYTISLARGEWVFIIDADEALSNDFGLIALFKNQEKLNRINTIVIKMKDFTKSSDKNMFFEYISPRLFKNDGSFKYEGSVHNQPISRAPEYLVEDSEIQHFGYDSDNSELMALKFERTKSLLLAELSKNPEDIYYLFQLASTYRMAKQFKDSLESIQKAFDLVMNQGYRSDMLYVVKAYILALKDMHYEKRVINHVHAIKEIVCEDIDLCFYYGDAYFKLNSYELALEYYNRYLYLLEKYKTEGVSNIDLLDSIQTMNLESVARLVMGMCYFKLGLLNGVLDQYERLEISSFTSESFEPYLNALIKLDNESSFDKLIEKAQYLDGTIRAQIIRIVESVTSFLDKSIEFKYTSKNKCLSSNYEMLLLTRALYEKKSCLDSETLATYFESNFQIEDVFYSDYLFFILQNGFSILGILRKYAIGELDAIFKYLFKKHSLFGDFAIELMNSANPEGEDLRTLIELESNYLEYYKDSSYVEEVTEDLFINRVRWSYRIFNVEAIENYGCCLNGENRAYSNIIKTLKNHGSIELCLAAIQKSEIRNKQEIMNVITKKWHKITNYVFEIQNDVKSRDDDTSAVNKELAILSETLKNQIQNLVSQSRLEESISLIDSYLEINPHDLDLILLKSTILLEFFGAPIADF